MLDTRTFKLQNTLITKQYLFGQKIPFTGTTHQCGTHLNFQKIKQIHSGSITVSDMNKALNFYTEVLTLKKISI